MAVIEVEPHPFVDGIVHGEAPADLEVEVDVTCSGDDNRTRVARDSERQPVRRQ